MRWVVLLTLAGGCQALFRLDPLPPVDAPTSDTTSDGRGSDAPTDAVGCSVFQPPVDYAAMSLPASMVIVDLNGDTRPDVVLGSVGTRTVQAFQNTGTAFTPQGEYGTTIGPASMASGQLNGDSSPDLVIADGSANIQVMIAQASFAFALGNTYTMNTPAGLAVGDYDGDGKDDVVATDSSDHQVRGFVGAADGTLASLDLATGVASNPTRIVVTSIDGDNKADFAIADTGSVQFTIVKGNQFSVSNATLPGVPADVAAAELNGDMATDLLFSLPGSQQLVAALAQNPMRLTATPGHMPTWIALGDVDHDGKVDVVFYDDAAPAIVEMRGNGDGSFGDSTGSGEHVFTLPARAAAIAVADFNGDQRADVAVALGGTMPRLLIFTACP